MNLNGKVAIVTGAGNVKGIGAHTARVLAQAGAKVVIADLAGPALEETTGVLKGEGFDIVACPADISQENQVEALIAFTEKTFGKLDVLDNNAASQGHQGDLTIGDMPVDLWDKIFSVNARGTMLMCKHAVKLMIKGGGGSIVNISSGTAHGGDFFASAYAATKGAINTLTKYVAVQYGAQGIRCNAIAPGLVMTPALAAGMPLPMQEIFRRHSLTQKLGQPDDIAQAVLFLASDVSRFLTGQIVPVDGGIYAQAPTIVEVADLFAGAAKA